jgi:guanylate kinase
MNKPGLSIILSAPSGTGKTTVMNRLMKRDPRFIFSISTTSRPPRPGEEDGKEYHFVEEEEFLRKIDNGDFLEWAMVHQRYYGTEKKEIDRIHRDGRIPILDVDVQGARSLRSVLNNALYIFLIPPSFQELSKRLMDRRSDSPEQVHIRLENARRELQEFSLYDSIIVNEVVDEAVDSILALVRCRNLDRDRQADKIEQLLEEFHDNTPG